MAMSPLKVKKYIGFTLIAGLPTLMFFLFQLFNYGFLFGLLAWFLGLILAMILTTMVLYKHPFISLAENKGLVVLTIDSTGVIQPYIIQSDGRNMGGKIRGRQSHSTFDRNVMGYLRMPKPATLVKKLFKKPTPEEMIENKITPAQLKEQKERYDNANFEIQELKTPKGDKSSFGYAFGGMPCLFYNTKLDTFISKEDLVNLESDGTIKHFVGYLKQKVEELNINLRDFGRYVVEQTRPKKGSDIFKNPMFWIILLGVGAVIMVFLFGGDVSGALSNAGTKTLGGGLVGQ